MMMKDPSCTALVLIFLFFNQGPSCLVRAQASEIECNNAFNACGNTNSACITACVGYGPADGGLCQSGCYDRFEACASRVERLCPSRPPLPYDICTNIFAYEPTVTELSDGLLDRSEFYAMILASSSQGSDADPLCNNVPLFLVDALFADLAVGNAACAPCRPETPDVECCNGQDLKIGVATEEAANTVCGVINFIIQTECAKVNERCIPNQVPSCVTTNEACAPDCSVITDPEDTTSCLKDCIFHAAVSECFEICTGVALTADSTSSPNSTSGTRHPGESMFLTLECWVGAVLLLWTLV